jgi:hypothetical protein
MAVRSATVQVFVDHLDQVLALARANDPGSLMLGSLNLLLS